jgi:DNA-binding CsgD family transcriptional regulator
MLPGDKALFELVGSLYEAAAYPERWQEFLRLVSGAFDLNKAVVTVHDAESGRAAAVHQSIGISPEGIREYNAHYGAKYPVLRPVLHHLRRKGAWCGLSRSVVAEKEYLRSQYYNEWGRKYGSYASVLGAIGSPPSQVMGLSILRSEEEPPLGTSAVELMSLLMPHLNRVFMIHRSMQTLRSTATAAVSALDVLGAAVVAINGAGEVVFANSKAEGILRCQDGLTMRGKQLAALHSSDAGEFARLVRAAAGTGAGRGLHPGGAMFIHRREREPLRVSVVPFSSSHMLTDVSPSALIFIVDPEMRPASRATILSSLYHLTPAENLLTDSLLQGLSLTAAAERLRVTAGTARFMLKSVFHKTGTHRQSELMRLLLSLPNVAAVR